MTTSLATITPLERPRERMLVLGASALGDAELLALILGGGHALQRAGLLLGGVGGLGGLAAAMPQELAEMPGIGDASATALCAAVELSRRLERLGLPYDEPLQRPADVHRFVVGALRGAPQETFLILGLDARQRVRLVREVAKGSLSSVQIHPREVFRPLVRAGAHAVILVHNHPSGEVEPSEADMALTARLVDVGWLVGIAVLDHLIVSDSGCFSLADSGMMPVPAGLSLALQRRMDARERRARSPPEWGHRAEDRPRERPQERTGEGARGRRRRRRRGRRRLRR